MPPHSSRPRSSSLLGSVTGAAAIATLVVGMTLGVGCEGAGGTHVRAVGDEAAIPSASASLAVPTTPHAELTHASTLPFAFVDGAGGELVVLLGQDGSDVWASGEPRLVEEGAIFVARRDIDMTKLPAQYAGFVGSKMILGGPSGDVCEATGDSLSMIVRADPRYETRQDWEGTVEGATHAPTPKAEIAQEVWGMETAYVVMHVKPLTGSCAGATWAHGASASSRSIAPAITADPVLTSDALAYVHKLPSFVAAEKEYRTTGELPRAKSWDLASYSTSTISAFTTSVGVRYVWVSMQSGEGCGGFNAGIGVLLRQDSASPGGFRVVHEQEGGVTHPITALLDEGAGMPTLLFDQAALRAENETYRFDSIEVYSHDCPC